MKKHHVLYIHTHDSGQIFSPYGYQVPTDHLLEFSKDATVFHQVFCASPTCSPSRSALVTGKYPHHNGMMGLANRGFCLNDYREHMVTVFNNNGYTTALCGIQHEYGRYSDHQKGAEKIGYHQDISMDCTGLQEKDMVQWDDRNTRRCVEWLMNYKSEKPFFLSFGFFSTHREYPDPSVETQAQEIEVPKFLNDCKTVREDFRGHIESLKRFDHNFGMILDALKHAGLYEDTIIFFTSDHGIAFPGAKCTLSDAGIKVPLIMRVPRRGLGTHVDSLISQVDILPTLCSLLGLFHMGTMEGKDFSLLFDQPDARIRNEIFAEINFHTSYEPVRCIRTPDYKYIRYYDLTCLAPHLSNIDNSMTKQLYMQHGFLDGEKQAEQFYDLRDDHYEVRNLIGNKAYETQIEQLRARLAVIQLETEDPILGGSIPIQEGWVVNTNECIDPKSKNPKDYLTPQVPEPHISAIKLGKSRL